MTDDIHKGRTPIGVIVNERDSRITFRYTEDPVVQRAANRIELERVKRIERKAARRAHASSESWAGASNWAERSDSRHGDADRAGSWTRSPALFESSSRAASGPHHVHHCAVRPDHTSSTIGPRP